MISTIEEKKTKDRKKHVLQFAAVLLFAAFVALSGSVLAEEETRSKPLYPGFTPIEESKAYQQYVLRPQTELSKLIFLIDRFGEADAQVLYENINYPASFSAKFCRAFLPIHYKQETAEYWVKHWATTSFPSGKPIWLKLPDGSFLRTRDVFLDELAALDRLVKES